MFKNYFKVAIRNILKHKFFSAINILGMTVGITASLLIILYIQDELSFDRFHANAARIYQVGLHGKIGGQDINVSSTCPPMAGALVAEVPEVESATRILQYSGQVVVKEKDKAFIEERVFFADSNFFSFFSYKLLQGDPRTALKEPNTLVVTSRIAKKYFGTTDAAMGQLLTIGNDEKAFKITGIAEDSPANSHFRYEFLIAASTSPDLQKTEWLNNFMYTYFTLRAKADIKGVESKLRDLALKYAGPEIEKFMGVNMKEMEANGGAYGYYVTKVTDIHLHSTSQGDLTPGNNAAYVYGFGIIAVFIMVIACINFMNMSTARSAGRAKEVGLRKTLGSLREQMIAQFLAESMIYSLLAMVLSLVAAWLLLPSFNTIAAKELEIGALINFKFILGIVSVVIFVGLAAGSYPAFYLTSFNVVEVLKGKVRAGAKSQLIRSGLVVFQFGISILLIIGTAVVLNQLRFMQDRDLGIDKHNVIYVHNMNRLGTNKQTFQNALNQRADVVASSFSNNAFPGVGNTTVFKAAGDEHDHIMGLFGADFDQQKVMKFTMIKGRYFSKEFPSDSDAIILNETAVREFGWKEPINENVLYSGDGPQLKPYKVIGVFRDFNFESLKEKVRPLSVMLRSSNHTLGVRYSGKSSDIIRGIDEQWRKYAASEPLQYKFLDENYDELFRSEQRLSSIIMIFSGLAIFIACLGLFALAAFTAEQRTKEIGIRKSMGASVPGLTLMMSSEFIKLVLIAFVISSIPTWFLADWWLKGFAYRVAVNPWIFVVSGAAAIAVAWLTVSYQSLKAAAADPVKSLRYE